MRTPKISKKIGLNIRRARKKSGLSQGDLARKLLFVDRAYISSIENGHRNPTVNTLEKIAAALRISIKNLF